MTDKIKLYKRFQKIASQLEIGEEIEKEHKNDTTAKDIAETHLKENPEYYQKIKGVKKETLLLPQTAILKLKNNLKLAQLEIDHHHRIEFEQRGTFRGASLVENKASKFWEYFLLTAKDVNGNGWGVSPDTIDTNIKDFIGQPFVITAKSWFANSEYGDEYTHPYIPTNHLPTIFGHQNKFAVGIIRDVIKKGDDYSAMVEPFPKFANRTPPAFCSPGIFQTNRSEPEGNIRSWRALHLAGLDSEPAYGARVAILKGSCTGTKEECKVSFHGAKLTTGIECPILFSRFQRIAEFKEEEHPRKDDGEFTCKECGKSISTEDKTQHEKEHIFNKIKMLTLNDGTSIFVNSETGEEIQHPTLKEKQDKKEQERISKLDVYPIKLKNFSGNIHIDKSGLRENFDPKPYADQIDDIYSKLPKSITENVKDIELTGNFPKGSDPFVLGTFDPTTKRIRIVPISDKDEFASVLTHETGHAKFDKLTDEQKKKWIDVSKDPISRYTVEFSNQIIRKFSNNPKLDIRKKAKEAFSKRFYDEQFAEFIRIKFTNSGNNNTGGIRDVLYNKEKLDSMEKVFNEIQ